MVVKLSVKEARCYLYNQIWEAVSLVEMGLAHHGAGHWEIALGSPPIPDALEKSIRINLGSGTSTAPFE
jgi:hypothetical protein